MVGKGRLVLRTPLALPLPFRSSLLVLERGGPERRNKGKHDTRADVDNVLGDEEDGCVELARNRDGELGVEALLLISASGVVDEVVVDNTRLVTLGREHAVEDVDEEDAIRERRVLEGAHRARFAALLGRVVSPPHNLLVGNAAPTLGDGGQRVVDGDTHKLPHETEHKRARAVANVRALDTDEVHAVSLGEVDGVVVVLDSLEARQLLAVLGLVDAALDDATGDDLLKALQQDGAVLEVLEEVVHSGLDVERVEPKGEDARLTLALGVKVLDLGRRLGLLEGREAGPEVEEVGDEREVELRVTRNERVGRQEAAAAELVGVLQNLFGALVRVGSVQGT